MSKSKKENPKRQQQRIVREKKKEFLGSDSTHERLHSERTKTKRALITEIFGNTSKQANTKPEQFVEDVLTNANIQFIKQKAVRYINVDFYLPEYKTVIGVAGTYWHCCPKCYPNGPKNKQQALNLIKDQKAKQVIQEEGLKFLEVWECCDIQDKPEETKQKILSYVNK